MELRLKELACCPPCIRALNLFTLVGVRLGINCKEQTSGCYFPVTSRHNQCTATAATISHMTPIMRIRVRVNPHLYPDQSSDS